MYVGVGWVVRYARQSGLEEVQAFNRRRDGDG